MKKSKLFSFLRSMRFGMLLLTVIAVLSVVGTLVPQGRTAEYYESAYGDMAKVIAFTGADHIYGTWYYIGLFAALCLNLLLCSLLRAGSLKMAGQSLLLRAEKAAPLNGIDAQKVRGSIRKLGYRQMKENLYLRHALGIYGSFVTHLGMLLLVIAAACTFALEQKADSYVMVGDHLDLGEGRQVAVDAFLMENSDGQLDYISELTLTDSQGVSCQASVTVNNPAKMESFTIYQQSYAFAAVLDIQTSASIPAEQVILNETAFISLDGVNGIQYMSVYGDYMEYENGQIMPVSSAGMTRPCYLVGVFDGGNQEMRTLLPDEPIEIGGVTYTFREPQAYPGLRVKSQPGWVLPLLYTSFAVLVAGLYLCFFHIPSAICLKNDVVRVVSSKESFEAVEQLESLAD